MVRIFYPIYIDLAYVWVYGGYNGHILVAIVVVVVHY